MKKSKGVIKIVANSTAIVSFILAAICGVYFYINCQELGLGDTITASWMASCLFFIFLSTSLMIIGNANLPSFKFDKPQD